VEWRILSTFSIIHDEPKIIQKLVLGNKTDREDREIPTYVGEDFAQRNNMYFMETSAKEADNVEKLFMEIAHALIEVKNIL